MDRLGQLLAQVQGAVRDRARLMGVAAETLRSPLPGVLVVDEIDGNYLVRVEVRRFRKDEL